MKNIKLLLVGALGLGLVGCVTTKPIATINSSVPVGLSYKKVETAILGSDTSNRGWVLRKEGKNLISGKIINRGHSAQVSIPFTTKGYSINYVTSQGLKSENGKIHPNYNRWVTNLDNDIQARLIRQ